MFEFTCALLSVACVLFLLIASVLLIGITIQFFAENFYIYRDDDDDDDWGDGDDRN